ncbi:MAG: type III-A CRISPR-associated RAMP protein Csm3 [Sphingomonadaceae bacterium]
MATLKLVGITQIRARLVVATGLHIGAGDLAMRIGGIDNPVVRHPVTDEPYVPGSSLKGKIRALLEWTSGAIRDEKPLSLDQRGEPGVEPILRLFGVGGGDASNDIGPSRLSVSDAPLGAAFRAPGRNAPVTEAKFENSINRIQGTATNPRQTERVVAGTEFDFCAAIRRFEGDEGLVDLFLKGLRLLEMDALGGSGSRGYGKVRFEDLTIDGKPASLPGDPFEAAA